MLSCRLLAVTPHELDLRHAAAHVRGHDVTDVLQQPSDRDVVRRDVDEEAVESTHFRRLQYAARELHADALLLPVVADDEGHFDAIAIDRAEAGEADHAAVDSC